MRPIRYLYIFGIILGLCGVLFFFIQSLPVYAGTIVLPWIGPFESGTTPASATTTLAGDAYVDIELPSVTTSTERCFFPVNGLCGDGTPAYDINYYGIMVYGVDGIPRFSPAQAFTDSTGNHLRLWLGNGSWRGLYVGTFHNHDASGCYSSSCYRFLWGDAATTFQTFLPSSGFDNLSAYVGAINFVHGVSNPARAGSSRGSGDASCDVVTWDWTADADGAAAGVTLPITRLTHLSTETDLHPEMCVSINGGGDTCGDLDPAGWDHKVSVLTPYVATVQSGDLKTFVLGSPVTYLQGDTLSFTFKTVTGEPSINKTDVYITATSTVGLTDNPTYHYQSTCGSDTYTLALDGDVAFALTADASQLTPDSATTTPQAWRDLFFWNTTGSTMFASSTSLCDHIGTTTTILSIPIWYPTGGGLLDCVTDVAGWLFIPDPTVLSSYTGAYNQLLARAPFGYAVQVASSTQAIFTEQASSSTSVYFLIPPRAYTSSTTTTMPLFDTATLEEKAGPLISPLRSILGVLVWLSFLLALYEFAVHFARPE